MLNVDNMEDKSTKAFLDFYNNPELKKSSKEQDMFQHIDVTFKNYSFDIKGKKALKQNGNIQEEYTWIERTNVRGNKGWIKGNADYIVFQYKDGYLFCNREKLLQYCKSLFSPPYKSTLMPKNIDDRKPYILYKRPNRKDCVFLIKFHDLITLGKFDNTGNIENIVNN